MSTEGPIICLRRKMTNVRFLMPRINSSPACLQKWCDEELGRIEGWKKLGEETIHLSEGLSDHIMALEVQRYVPKAAQSCDLDADYGTPEPTYALLKPSCLQRSISEHLHKSMNQAFATTLSRSGGFVRWTYQLALQYCKSPSTSAESLRLLRDTFELWTVCRVSMRDFVMLGATGSERGALSSAPLLEAQVHLTLFWDFQKKLSGQVLQALERLFLKRDPSTWVVRYLVIFMLLHNTSLVIADDASFARKHNLEVSVITICPLGALVD